MNIFRRARTFRSAGLCLMQPAAQIDLGDVVRRTETDFTLVERF